MAEFQYAKVFQYAAEHKLFWQITTYKPLLAMPEEPVGFTAARISFEQELEACIVMVRVVSKV